MSYSHVHLQWTHPTIVIARFSQFPKNSEADIYSALQKVWFKEVEKNNRAKALLTALNGNIKFDLNQGYVLLPRKWRQDQVLDSMIAKESLRITPRRLSKWTTCGCGERLLLQPCEWGREGQKVWVCLLLCIPALDARTQLLEPQFPPLSKENDNNLISQPKKQMTDIYSRVIFQHAQNTFAQGGFLPKPSKLSPFEMYPLWLLLPCMITSQSTPSRE